MKREFFEETGLVAHKISFVKTVYLTYPTYSFTFHIYSTEVREKIRLTLSPNEHISYKWCKKEDLAGLPLIEDLEECMRIVS